MGEAARAGAARLEKSQRERGAKEEGDGAAELAREEKGEAEPSGGGRNWGRLVPSLDCWCVQGGGRRAVEVTK
ncbi:hypothetical protein PR202_gb19107 [Eleusine coracana subsp. coracana]|uniref:Uncharacterized protein n=1 Tax=Eleusine coracana subsp. coracana TaxID=191504 RepID=A0AAV5F746_ELECO|nr:hypothetical protein PR202_gb19107 [Eleusine coracana subsp. coracana]